MLELTGRKASAKYLKYHISAKSLHRCAYKKSFPACFLLEERLHSYGSKFFPLESRVLFPFRADPIQERFLSWKANKKSQKLLYFKKMAEEHGSVSSYLNVFGYTTVLYRLFCK